VRNGEHSYASSRADSAPLERVLAQTEKPAAIVRRRLEQAGYEAADGLEKMGGDDLTFLLKFVYKSQLLGPAVCDESSPSCPF
jgi:hypothetical protein